MKRPLGFLTLVFAGGIVAADYFVPPLPWLFIASILLVAATVWIKRGGAVALAVLLFVAGWSDAILHTAPISPVDLRQAFDGTPAIVTIRGTLADPPRVKTTTDPVSGKETTRTLATLQTAAFKRDKGEWQPSEGRLQVTTLAALDESFRQGMPVEISGVLQHPPEPLAPGLFDYRSYLRRQGIWFQFTARDEKDWLLLAPPRSLTISERFLAWAERAMQTGLPPGDPALQLLYAMILGSKTAIDPENSDHFMKSGTLHVFAISGLHIALIAGIIVVSLKMLRVPRRACAAVAIPLLWFYTAATGWQPSAVRSSIMMTVIIAGWSLKRPVDLLNSLSVAALIILVLDPLQLFQASFQLSFFVVLSIALLMPPFEKLRMKLLQHDPFLPKELLPRWQRWLDLPIRWVTVSFITSVAAWLGSIPLAAFYFHLFTPVSLLANLVVVPLSSAALTSAFASLITALFPGPLSDIFNNASWGLMKAMIWMSAQSTSLPTAFFHMRSPTWYEMLGFYGLAFAICSGWLFTNRFRRFLIPIAASLVVTWVFSLMLARQEWKITVLPLGGGEALHIDAPGSADDLLIDCGDDRAVQYVTRPFLQAQGINRLPRLLLTHGDVKHTGGTRELIETFGIGEVLTSGVSFRSSPYRKLITDLDLQPGLRNTIAANTNIAGWRVLHPVEGDKFSQADDGPLVLTRTIRGFTFLFVSDLGRDGQNLLLERHPELRADVVIAGIPRGSEPLNDNFLSVLQPQLIVITDAAFPATERASPALCARLEKQPASVLFTRNTGAVTFTWKKSQLAIRLGASSSDHLLLNKR